MVKPSPSPTQVLVVVPFFGQRISPIRAPSARFFSKKTRTCRRKSPSREQAPGRRHLFFCFVSGREGERDGGRELSLVFRVLWPANRPVGGCCSVLSLSFSVAFAPPSSPHRIPSGEPASPSWLGLNARKRKEKETKSTESRERQSKKRGRR